MRRQMFKKHLRNKFAFLSRISVTFRCGLKSTDEANDIWQARINQGWRFYFQIEGDVYISVIGDALS
jgi:plasmid maintenance system killer protein